MARIPLIYLWMYKKLKEEDSYTLTVKTVNEILRRTVLGQIPKQLHHDIIKEMERYNLIQRINNRKGYRLLPNDEYKKVVSSLI